jgi:hypothetical protein
VTNFHVVQGAYDAQVKLKNGEVFDNAMVLDYDARHDVVLLKIRAVSLPTVTLGEASDVEQGDRAYAIGCPEGYSYTISDGLISAKRVIGGTEMFQISVPISHGSSGGPLYDVYGRVIGITTAGIMEGAQNLNFAVPLKYATVLLDSPPKSLTLEQLTRLLPAKREAASAPAAPKSRTHRDPSGSVELTVPQGWEVREPPPQGNILISLAKGNEANILMFWVEGSNADEAFAKIKSTASKTFGKLTDYSKKVDFSESGSRVCMQSFSLQKDRGFLVAGAIHSGSKLIGLVAVTVSADGFDDVIETIKSLQF